MKILLVSPHVNPKTICFEKSQSSEPLALEYVGAAVKKDHDVKLIDLRSSGTEVLEETLESFQPDVIASGGYTPEINPVKHIFAQAKKKLPEILTVAGGIHTTLVPESLFEDYVDVVVTGEGALPFQKICERHEQRKSFDDVENIFFRGNGKMVFTHKKEFPSLDTLPFPDRSLSEHLRHLYTMPMLGDKSLSLASMRSSTGCAFQCKFCSLSTMLNRLYTRSIDQILEELSTIKEDVIFWVDDEFLLNGKKTMELAKEIEKAGIKKYHYFQGRSDTIARNPECIEEWARIGLKLIFIGFEAHREEELEAMNKKSTVHFNEEAVRICKANGVNVKGNFIVSTEYDIDDFRSLAAYVKKMDLEFPGFAVMTPFPGTPLFNEVEDQLLSRNYDLYDAFHPLTPTKLPIKRFCKEFINLIKGSVPLRKKLKMVKQLEPELRKKVMRDAKKVFYRTKHAYRDYDDV
jgi:radical SAM superfamily enzyme YgiQ (UPF0313 family)